jgi:uncharacterized membrane protein
VCARYTFESYERCIKCKVEVLLNIYCILNYWNQKNSSSDSILLLLLLATHMLLKNVSVLCLYFLTPSLVGICALRIHQKDRWNIAVRIIYRKIWYFLLALTQFMLSTMREKVLLMNTCSFSLKCNYSKLCSKCNLPSFLAQKRHRIMKYFVLRLSGCHCCDWQVQFSRKRPISHNY